MRATLLLLVGLVACDGEDSTSVAFRDEQHPPDPQGGFVTRPDLGGGVPPTCSTYDQDCPAGFKCTYALGRGWESFCVPVVMSPAEVGEPCTAPDDSMSGLDDCERGAVCGYVDPRTNLGTCLPYMLGNTNEYRCADPWHLAAMSSNSYPICVPTCNPLVDDCAPGKGCYPGADRFACGPDASGDMGVAGDPCEFNNVCAPGHYCSTASKVLGCGGASACCTPYCDTSDPVCPDGLSCVSWWSDVGDAPPGQATVGKCIARP